MTKQEVETLITDATYWLGASEERLARMLAQSPAQGRGGAARVVRVMAALEESREPAPRPQTLALLNAWMAEKGLTK